MGLSIHGITFGSFSGEGIASKRTEGGNKFGLDIFTNTISRISISNSGNVGISTSTPGAPWRSRWPQEFTVPPGLAGPRHQCQTTTASPASVRTSATRWKFGPATTLLGPGR